MAGEAYQVTLPDGSTQEGNVGDDGVARIEGIDPGSCKISFPKIDKDYWKKK